MIKDEEFIFGTFKRTIEPRNIVLDIGCGDARWLKAFDELGYKNLIGIDKHLKGDTTYNFFNAKSEKTGVKIETLIEENVKTNYLTLLSRKHSEFPIKDFKYSAVILRHVLHFIPFDEQMELLETIYDQVEKGGAIYVKLHHNTHPDYLNPPEHIKKIAENIVEKSTGSRIYFVNAPTFKEEIRKFNPLWDCYTVDEKSITVILKKWH